MMEICGDTRFEIIAKAKEHLLDATNIDTSEDEMKVLDSFLFRCWQMGWLDRYDERKDEPQTDCRITGTIGYRCPKCGRGNFLNNESNCVYCGALLIKTEPQTEDPPMDEYYKDHDEFYDCDRYVVTNDEGEKAYNCIGCEQTDCAWK